MPTRCATTYKLKVVTTWVMMALYPPAMHELKAFAILTVYLYVTLGAVIMMKTAVLHSLHKPIMCLSAPIVISSLILLHN